MIVSSAITGLIGLVLAYALAVPLGSAMARFKNTWIDSLSTGALTFLLALPTIALVYIVRLIGSSIALPDSFPILGAGDWRSYVLPAVILGLLGAPGTAIWIRRYMIDLQSQDFVRFARAKGLSEKEISNKHIFKNAMVPLVSGIPGAIIGVIGGATLTETVFAFPGMGKMLIDSVKASNNSMVVMIVSSAITGLIGLVLAYALAVPLGSAMARFKNTWIDSLSTGALTFLLALPTIALVYIVRLIGSSIALPDSFPILGAGDWRSYVLPAVILGLLGAPGTAIWIRRYMIDLQSQDFVRFARAKGLSEKEISNKHIFKNAMVPLVSGIPGAIIGVIGGATLTETVFAFPGMGKMLIDSVKASNNSMVVGLVFIFTCISIFSRLLGDIWMTIIDPRIKLTEKGSK
ncbi:peptide ABC transporter permease [Streptococcus pneumoniae]|nr:peptide ABC transporter permease [Streptococcus pneumoniae]